MKANRTGIINAIEALLNNELIVVADSKTRENEADLICNAQNCTKENINYMCKYGRGLICLPIHKSIADRLNLKLLRDELTISKDELANTPFTVAIDHISNSTGISCSDRSKTARAVCDPNAKPSDFLKPGHLFPLISAKYGLKSRKGHTECTVDLMKLAKLKPAGLCCEIIDDEGNMVSNINFVEFANKHNLVYITIDEIIEYLEENNIDLGE